MRVDLRTLKNKIFRSINDKRLLTAKTLDQIKAISWDIALNNPNTNFYIVVEGRCMYKVNSLIGVSKRG
jgi:hypothetical protein